MARYTGPKARINRRLGGLIYESSGASRAYERRQQPPGMHTRGKRPSNYGQALYEKRGNKDRDSGSGVFANLSEASLGDDQA